MALEDQLEALTNALNENTKRLDAMLNGAGKAPATTGGGTTKAPAKATTKPKTTTKKVTTEEDVAARVTGYLKTGDAAERKERKDHVKQIIEHYGADRFTTIDPESFDEALGYLKAFEDGDLSGTPFEGDDEEEEEEDSVV